MGYVIMRDGVANKVGSFLPGITTSTPSPAPVVPTATGGGDQMSSSTLFGGAAGKNITPAQVTEIYRTVLDRDPDPEGLLYWSQNWDPAAFQYAVNAAKDKPQTAASPEAISGYSSLDPKIKAFIDAGYADLFYGQNYEGLRGGDNVKYDIMTQWNNNPLTVLDNNGRGDVNTTKVNEVKAILKQLYPNATQEELNVAAYQAFYDPTARSSYYEDLYNQDYADEQLSQFGNINAGQPYYYGNLPTTTARAIISKMPGGITPEIEAYLDKLEDGGMTDRYVNYRDDIHASEEEPGMLGILGKIAGVASWFVPGMQPIALALNAANAIKNGDLLSLALAAYGGYNMLTTPSGVLDIGSTVARDIEDFGLDGAAKAWGVNAEDLATFQNDPSALSQLVGGASPGANIIANTSISDLTKVAEDAGISIPGLNNGTSVPGLNLKTSIPGLNLGTTATNTVYTPSELMSAFPSAFPNIQSASDFLSLAPALSANPSLYSPYELARTFPGAFPTVEDATKYIKEITGVTPQGSSNTTVPPPVVPPPSSNTTDTTVKPPGTSNTTVPPPGGTVPPPGGTTPTVPFDINDPSTWPWKDIFGSGLSIAGGLFSGNSAKEAAQIAADAQLKAAEMQRFRPVGIQTRFGGSSFGYDANGNLNSAAYGLNSDIAAQREKLLGTSGGLLNQFAGSQAATAPMGVAAQSAMQLGQGYLNKTPQEQAAQYMAEQQALLSPYREREYASLQNKLQQQGRLGLATGGTTSGLMAANPELEAWNNAKRMQDLQLAAQATQGGMDYATFGAGMVGTGGDLLKSMYGTQQSSYAPYDTAVKGAAYLEGLGQQPLDIGINLGAKGSAANAGAASLMSQSAQTAQPANAFSPWGTLLGNAGNAITNYQTQQQQQQAQQQALQQQQMMMYNPYTGARLI